MATGKRIYALTDLVTFDSTYELAVDKSGDIQAKKLSLSEFATSSSVALNTTFRELFNLGTPAQGEILYFDGTDYVPLAPGTSGYVLSTQGAGANPQWVEQTGGGGGAVDSVFGRTGVVLASTNDYTWAQINKTISDIADLTTKSHTSLTDIGTNTHSQIDDHIADTSIHFSDLSSFDTGDLAEATDKNYVTDAQLVVIGNTSGTNTGDQDLSSYVVGPASSTDDGIVTFDGTSGKLVKSVLTIEIAVTDDDTKVPTSGAIVDYVSGLGGGDMLSTTYDPTGISADAFDMDNMVQGSTNYFVTSSDITNLGNLSGTNTGDQSAGDFNHDDLSSITGTVGEYNHPTDAQMTVLGNTSGTNTGDQAASDFNHDDLSNITGTVGEYNHPTDAQMVVLGNTSGTNTGDQDLSDYFNTTTDTLDDIDDGTTYGRATLTQLGYIDQDVTSGSSPTLDGTNFSGIPNGALDETYVNADGTVALTANWDAGSYKITAEQLESDVATGTAPLVIASTTLVSNLNTDLLDSQEGSYYLDWGNFANTPTSLSGYSISDTKANFNSALSDGSFAFDGGAFHDGFSDYVANEHIDWTADQGGTNINNLNITGLSIGTEVTGASTSLSDTSAITYNADTDVSGNGWVLNEDNMASDSDTKLATQQSIKAYVDSSLVGISASSMTVDVTQTGHGFSVGDVIKSSGTDGEFAQAQADSEANAEVVGYVVVVDDVNNFTYALPGSYITTGVPAVAAGTVLWLDPSTPGAVTSTEPTTVGDVSKPLLVVIDNGDTAIFINTRGMVLTEASDLITATSVDTLENKAIKLRTYSTTDRATSTIDVESYDVYELTAIANTTTFSITGTPFDGQRLMIRFKDAGSSKTLTWTDFTEIGTTLPTATTAGKWHYVGCMYVDSASAWHVIAVIEEE